MEAAQRYLDGALRIERSAVGLEDWAVAMAAAIGILQLPECHEAAKPVWWNDEELKELSGRVVRAAPNHGPANSMRAFVLSGQTSAWEAGPRSAAELKEAAVHFDRAAALCNAPVLKANYLMNAEGCRDKTEGL